jgi:hypothetical protein
MIIMYLGYPNVIKLAFCDRRGKEQSVKSTEVVVRSEILQRPSSYKQFLACWKLPRELTDNVKNVKQSHYRPGKAQRFPGV